jgi:hypothetical protein
VAAHYPVPPDRPFRDLDLIVDDARAAQAAFVAAGFLELVFCWFNSFAVRVGVADGCSYCC